MIQYFDDGETACFNGLSFRRDKKTGYYLSSQPIDGKRKRLHVYVWEYYKGAIPKGYQVHHIDFNKANNELDNLALLDAKVHAALHGNAWSDERKNKRREVLQKCAMPKAKEWHGSDEGIEWHKRHYEEIKDKLHIKTEFKCAKCGKMFIASNNGHNRFCSNACKSAYRRESGVDNETRQCECCGKAFITSRFSKAKTCSRRCAVQMRKNKGDS